MTMQPPPHSGSALAALTLALATLPAHAADTGSDAPRRPLWELGAGVAAVQLPDYAGADVSHRYLLPVPYVVYRGQWLRADREGARAVLIDTPGWELTLSAHASAPVRSHDNPARLGMANLPATVELGPKLATQLWTAADGSARLSADLPLRAVIGLTRGVPMLGTVLTPTLNLDLPRWSSGWNLGLQTGPTWGSQPLHAHFYGVSAADATAARPAYTARGGYAGWQALAAVSQRFDHTWIGAFVRVERLDGAAFADSPLVRQRQAVAAGVAVAWVLASSSQEARSDD
ncbi:MipA/OmpV family protein [Sphaerotilus sp.]|uniref:MipA/OmpV family protein n=1 Tax=Sphaerotilus sp. TaxID=2093942 RepID=UPI0034E2F1E2